MKIFQNTAECSPDADMKIVRIWLDFNFTHSKKRYFPEFKGEPKIKTEIIEKEDLLTGRKWQVKLASWEARVPDEDVLEVPLTGYQVAVKDWEAQCKETGFSMPFPMTEEEYGK